jgi:hypothetical protein
MILNPVHPTMPHLPVVLTRVNECIDLGIPSMAVEADDVAIDQRGPVSLACTDLNDRQMLAYLQDSFIIRHSPRVLPNQLSPDLVGAHAVTPVMNAELFQVGIVGQVDWDLARFGVVHLVVS